MKRILVVFFWLLASGLVQASAGPATKIELLVLGDDNYPPYSYLNKDGEPSGVYVEILQAVFSQMEAYDVEIQMVPWQRALAALEAGNVFAIFPPYYYDDRRFFIGRYSVPLYEEKVVVFCSPEVLEAKPRIWPDDFFGLVIGVNQGFALGGTAFWSAVEKQKIDLSQAQGNRQNLLMLMDGRIDCYLNDRLSITHILDQLLAAGEWSGPLPQETLVVKRYQGHLAYVAPHEDNAAFYLDFTEEFDRLFKKLFKDNEPVE